MRLDSRAGQGNKEREDENERMGSEQKKREVFAKISYSMPVQSAIITRLERDSRAQTTISSPGLHCT